MLPIKSYEPKKICLIFKKGEKHLQNSNDLNENHITRFNISEKPTVEIQTLFYTNVEFCIFARRKITNACLFVGFISQGWSYLPNDPR